MSGCPVKRSMSGKGPSTEVAQILLSAVTRTRSDYNGALWTLATRETTCGPRSDETDITVICEGLVSAELVLRV